MNLIKGLLLSLLTVFALQGVCASAEVVTQMTDQFITDLQAKTQANNDGLTEQQVQALKPILYNNINAREDVIASYLGQKGLKVKKQIRDELEPINQTMQMEAQEVLTPSQFDAFKAVQSANQDKVRERINQQF